MEYARIEEELKAAGLIGVARSDWVPLTGGVSSDIWRVAGKDGSIIVKRALPKLRVAAEWFADPARNRTEQNYLRYVHGFLPSAVPSILFSRDDLDFFAMEDLGDGYANWKVQLLAGEIAPATAGRIGQALGRIHRTSWQDEEAAEKFSTDAAFHELRIAPYFLAAAEHHPSVADRIRSEAWRVAETHLALAHGDFTPKNLLVAPERVVILDCEVAWFGDPAFDVCSILNHLLLKSILRPDDLDPLLDAAGEFLANYRLELGDARFTAIAPTFPMLLICLLLARVDGKSPVEYLDVGGRGFVRAFALERLAFPPANLQSVFVEWRENFRPGNRR